MVSKDLFPDFNPKYPDFMEDKRNLNSDETEFAMENFARLPQSVKNQLIQSGQAPQQYMKNIDTTTNLKNQMFGASGTPPQALTGGALNNITDYIPQAQTLMSTLYGKTPEQQEREDRINTGTMFLNFFTKMAAEASKPGATGLGSASIAGADTAKLYIDRINKERERKLKERQGVVSLATQLYSKDKPTGAPKDYTVVDANQVNRTLGTTYKQGDKATLTVNEFNKAPRGSLVGYEKDTAKYVPLYKDGQVTNVIENSDEYIKKITQDNWSLAKPTKPTSFTYKSVDAGIPAIYVTKEDAEKLLEPYVQNGLDPNSNAYKKIIKAITVPSDKPGLLGKEVIINDMYAMIKPVQIGEKIGDVVIQGNKDAPAPNFVGFKNEYSKKYGKEFQSTVGTYAEVIPRIQQAMDILISKNGPETGKLAEFTLPFREFVRGALGNIDQEINQQQTLQSISFYLATKMRPKGSGSTSDMEFKAYQKAALSLENTPITNYISLYAMKKMKENAELLNEKAFELIDSGQVRNVSELNAELKKIDRGIFEKFEYDGEMFDENNQLTPEFIVARDAWEASLPSGAVIVNSGIYPEYQDPYLVKEWRVR
jgi:hypothetical protein